MDIKPVKPKDISEVSQTETKSSRKVTTTTEGSRRRTDAFHAIDELKDNRSFFHKALGFLISDLDAKTLSDNFAEIKQYFEQYKEFGIPITIPEDILRNFETNTGAPLLGTSAFITAAQAEELKKLVEEGDKQLQEKLDQLQKVEEEKILQEKMAKRTYGPFLAKEIVENVIKEGNLTTDERKKFVSTNVTLRELAKPRERIILSVSDLLDPKNEKLQFAKENNLKLNVKLQNDEDIIKMISFMADSANSDLLKNLEVIQLGDIRAAIQLPAGSEFIQLPDGRQVIQLPDGSELAQLPAGSELIKLPEPDGRDVVQLPDGSQVSIAQYLINLMATNCPNLISFSCRDLLSEDLDLSELKNLTSVTFRSLLGGFLKISQLDNLTNFSCNITSSATLEFSQLKNLKSISLGKMTVTGSMLNFSELNSLVSLSITEIGPGLRFMLPPIPTLATLNLGNIGSICSIYLNELDNLESLSFGNIGQRITLKFPEEFPKLQHIQYGVILDANARTILESLNEK